jgi:hypothetical protein
MMKAALQAVSALTLMAVSYLTISVVVLQPPRANYVQGFAVAAFVVLQGCLTFVATSFDGRSGWIRPLTLVGGVSMTVLGVWMIRRTLAAAQFEGYAIVLGAMLALQGGLTTVAFARPPRI